MKHLARLWFARGLRLLRAHQRTNLVDHPINAEWTATLLGAARDADAAQRKGRRRKPLDVPAATRVLGPEAYEALRAPFQARADVLANEYYARLDHLKACLSQLAPAVELRRGGGMRLLDAVHESSYSTQGLGARRYAQQAAENVADVARSYGVGVEVREVVREFDVGAFYGSRRSKLSKFEVWVSVKNPLDVELLRRLPGPPLREWLRMCWKRGVNPRVFNPYLPVGLEEKLGLDYFGNETKEAP